MSSNISQPSCDGCTELSSTVGVRGRSYCRKCAAALIYTRTVKCIGKALGRQNQRQIRQIMVPISLGASCLSLLHIISKHLQSRTCIRGVGQSDQIYVLYIDRNELSGLPGLAEKTALENLAERYPQHTYFYANVVRREEDAMFVQVNPYSPKEIIVESEKSLEITGTRNTNYTLPLIPITDMSKPAGEARCPTSPGLLLEEVTATVAKQLGCNVVAWGHSRTRLAESALSGVALGQGCNLPWRLRAGRDQRGLLHVYPMEDILRSEAEIYSEVNHVYVGGFHYDGCSLRQDLTPKSSPTSVDGLVGNFLASMERTYPNIISNILRTSANLEVPQDQAAV